MVQKISSTAPVPAPDRVNAAPLQTGSSGANTKPSATPLPPAAQLHLSDAGSVSAALPHTVAQDPLDAQLIQEIRQRIDRGQFQIDFDQVAANILREAVAQTKGSPR